MTTRPFQVGLLLVTVGSLVLLWLTEIPLGIPGEWTWERIRLGQGRGVDVLLGGLAAGVVACGYAAFARLGAGRMAGCSQGTTAAWLGGLVAAGFAWLWIVQESPPAEYGLSKAPFVLYDPGASGYFFEALYRMDDAGGFLAGYEERMAEGDVLHIGTHPPGLFLFHWGLIRLCEQSPILTRFLSATQPPSVEEAFDVIDHQVRLGPPLQESGRAALWLSALLTQLAGVATVVPLYLLLRRDRSRQASWMAVSLWPLVPALAVFLPKSDVLYPFLGTAFLATWMYGWSRRSPLLCLSAGLLFWLGLFFSLALLPVALLAVCLTVWEARLRVAFANWRGWLRELGAPVAWGGGGFLAAAVVVWLGWEINLFSVWWWNYHNHAGFYEEFQRTYWKWLLVNPLELALAAGAPVVLLVVVSYAKMAKIPHEGMWKEWGPYGACALVWGLLWLSGKNSGEAARLWLVVMPWLIWLAGRFFEPPPLPDASRSSSSASSPVWLNGWLLVLALQALVCLATVTRVHGFHYGIR